jgi:Arc/MetJ-type ribon-helix-helix transcriptional regulator
MLSGRITRYHVENGRLAELMYRQIREIAENARGNMVALATPRFTDDRRAMPFVSRTLAELAKRLGAEERRLAKRVVYIIPVERLRQVTLRDVEEAAEAARRAMAESLERTKTACREKPMRERPRGEAMPIISVHLPLSWLRAMDELVRRGRYADRSEIIRTAIRQMLDRMLRPPDDVARPAEARCHTQLHEKMAIISFHLPSEWLRAMDELIREGRYPNRSEIIRTAIRQMLDRWTQTERPTERPSRERMAVISFHLPPELLKIMDRLVEEGRYPSRSEVVRTAIRQMLDKWRSI